MTIQETAGFGELMRPDVQEDPYPWYAELRSVAPVCPLGDDIWIAVGYDAVAAALREPEVFSSELGYGRVLTGGMGLSGVERTTSFGVDPSTLRMLLISDPPVHTRLRRLVSRAFTPRAISVLEPRLRQQCESMVEQLIDAGRDGDLVGHVAYPFPMTVIAELLGIPAERRDDFKRWSDALVGMFTGGWDPTLALQPVLEMSGFLAEVVAQRQAQPSDDLIGRLVVAADDEMDEPLSPQEISAFVTVLLVAGNETTTNLVGNAFDALRAHPEQARRIRADRSVLPGVIEETLRYNGPVQNVTRGARRDANLAGVDIPAGSTLIVACGAANRDPTRFAEPDRFDPDRDTADHFGFGHGIHFCLGAALARLEARIVAETLLDRTRSIEPTGEATRTCSAMLRGFSRVPVQAHAA